MCGIFGQATNNPKKINQGNIRILGMFNESRGKNSCGITVDGEIYHGLEKEKLFTDFMKGRKFDAKQIPVVFGHTRTSSVGAINEYNAHPFGFGENEQGNIKFIGVHNGTLHNHKDLAEEYNIEASAQYINQYNVELTRQKIDSEILLEILSKSGNDFSVLEKYNGRAALVWTDTDNPNIVYLYSGESAFTNYANSKVEEERPLIVYPESKNNLYFSSMPDSLYAIGGTDDDVFQIDYNTVYSVKNGDFANARKTKISRDECCISDASYGGTSRVGKSGINTTGFVAGAATNLNYNLNNHRSLVNAYFEVKGATANEAFGDNTSSLPRLRIPGLSNLYSENPLVLPENKKQIYNKKLRFYQNSELISGIFTHIEGWGFYKYGSDVKEAYDKWVRTVGVRFVDGDFDFMSLKSNEGHVIYTDPMDAPDFYYIYQGAVLKTLLDYTTMLEIERNQKKSGVIIPGLISYEKLSHMSLHAVIDPEVGYKKDEKAFKDGVLFSGVEKFFAFDKKYYIKNGSLGAAYKREKKAETPVIILPETTEKMSKIDYVNIDREKALKEVKDKLVNLELDEGLKYAKNIEKTIKNREILTEAVEDSLEDELNDQDVWQGNFDGQKVYYTLNQKNEKEALVLSDDEAVETVNKIINDHFVGPMELFQKCKEKLRPFMELSEAKEGVRLINNIDKILLEFVKDNN